MDARSLGLFRILFGLVLLSDLARRWVELGFWYTNSGLLPNHTLLWRPPAGRLFSLFFTVSNAGEAHLGFALCAAVYLLFLFGYRTRLMQVLVLVARVSLNSRLAVLENGGDMVMDLLCLLTLPLPLGARFSLDAVANAPRPVPVEAKSAEAKSAEAKSAEAKSAEAGSVEAGSAGSGSAEAGAVPARATPHLVVSIAVLGLLLQFATIYYFNAASKNGVAWRDGSAVHYALHQDKLVTVLGVWMREHLPLQVIRGLTWSTLVTEWLGFIFILTPFAAREARLIAVCVMPLLHLGFALGLNLGGFSPAMMSFYPLLLATQHWDIFSKRFGERVRPWRDKVEHAARVVLSKLPALPAPTPRSNSFRWLTEGAVVVVLVAITTEVLNDNTPVPKALRVKQPDWAKAIIEYPRILQGWRMFASEPPRTDSMIYVDAKTAGGARVDPYNQVASNQPFPAAKVVPSHMGQSQFFVMYSDRIPNAGYAVYRQAFQEWLVAYPERTGRPEDCLLSYHVYYVTDQSPDPGAPPQPKPLDRQLFMTYNAPADSPCHALRTGRPAPAKPRG